MRFIVLCLFLLTGLLSFNSHAVKVSDLYRVSVAVEDQSADSRKMGVQVAFQQLLIKVSGTQSIIENPTLVAAGLDSERYMQGFSYQTDLVDDQIYLQTWFSKALIDPLLKRAEAPIWGENRPLILNWVALEAPSYNGEATKRLIVSQNTPEWEGRFSRIFSERGLPVLWPTADTKDRSVLPIEHLWKLSPNSIKQASLRYQSDAVMAGRLKQSAEGTWHYDGALFNRGQTLPLSTSGNTPSEVLTVASSQVAQYFAERFAIKPSSTDDRTGIRVVISKVNDFTDYSQVLSYLNNITGVRNVEVAKIERGNLELYLSLEGDWAKVQRSIRLDKKLVLLQEKEFEWAR